jgi:hypothetical protein
MRNEDPFLALPEHKFGFRGEGFSFLASSPKLIYFSDCRLLPPISHLRSVLLVASFPRSNRFS